MRQLLVIAALFLLSTACTLQNSTADYVPYINVRHGVALSHPPDWTVTANPSGLIVVSPMDAADGLDYGSDWVMVSAVWPEYSDLSSEETALPADSLAPVAEAILWHRAVFMYDLLLIDPMEQIGDVEAITVNGQQKARAVWNAGIDEQRFLFLLHVVQEGDLVAVASSFPAVDSAGQATIETIMDTITVSERVYEPAGVFIPVTVGELYEGSWSDNEQIDHSFALVAGTPFLVLFQFIGDIYSLPETDVELYNADNEFVQSSYARGSRVKIYQLSPDIDGEYKLSFTPIGGAPDGHYRLLVFEPRLGAPGIIDVVDGELAVDQVDEIDFEGLAGELLIVVIQNDELGTLSLNMELLDPSGEGMAFVGAGLGDAFEAEVIELTQDGVYTTRLSQDYISYGGYRVILFRPANKAKT